MELKGSELYTFTTTMAGIVGCESVTKKGTLVMKEKNRVAGNLLTVFCQLNTPGVYFKLGMVDPAFV